MADSIIKNEFCKGTWTPLFTQMVVSSISDAKWYQAGNIFVANAKVTFGNYTVDSSSPIYLDEISIPVNGRTPIVYPDSNKVFGNWYLVTDPIKVGVLHTSQVNNNVWFFNCDTSSNVRLTVSDVANKMILINLIYTVG